jgi:hypothetical protein
VTQSSGSVSDGTTLDRAKCERNNARHKSGLELIDTPAQVGSLYPKVRRLLRHLHVHYQARRVIGQRYIVSRYPRRKQAVTLLTGVHRNNTIAGIKSGEEARESINMSVADRFKHLFEPELPEYIRSMLLRPVLRPEEWARSRHILSM